MALFPLPALVALGGWLWVFGTTSTVSIVYGLASLAVGVGAFAIWDREIGRGREADPETLMGQLAFRCSAIRLRLRRALARIGPTEFSGMPSCLPIWR